MRIHAFLLLATGLWMVSFPAKSDGQEAPREVKSRHLPGTQADGRILLPTQWSLRPAGKQLKLGDFPVNIALHPHENFAAILHAGYGEHEIVTVDLAALKIVSRVAVSETFAGLCFSPDGRTLYASGAGQEVVHQYAYSRGYLHDHREIRIAPPSEKFVPAGVAISPTGEMLYIACPWGNTVCLVPVGTAGAPGSDSARLAGRPRHLLLERDDYPYMVLPSRDGQRLYVSLWGRAAVAAINLKTEQVEATWNVEPHPTELALAPDESVLYVACANSNSVCVLDPSTGKTLEVIRSALHPQADNGSTPNSLALAEDGKVLLIANADNNNVAVMDVSVRGRSRSLGFIPAGWYPTSVRFGREGKILIANGKGLMSAANRGGPNSSRDPPETVQQYIGGLFRGTLSALDPPDPRQMAILTREAFACSPLRSDGMPVDSPPPGNPIPAQVGQPSPIKHCLYIIKENRTYDQVFGDLPAGNGDPALCIFPDHVTPNHHALAREFVLLDNFYVESEVSADGHEWSMAAYATDFVERTWPLLYRGSREGKLAYPSEGAFPIARPSSGYIWDRCQQAGVSYRSYGEFISNSPQGGGARTTRVATLEGHFDPEFHGYDLNYPDQGRADRFIDELRRFEREGEMPQFIVLRLPNDHTHGSTPEKPTPTAMVADNDLALGRVIEALSQSRFWSDTAVFVVEDDAQNGSDHVDAHRTVALVISPYTKRGFVDSSMYSTASMLRTMELILGLKPMTQFDAAALPMYHSFQQTPILTPYQHRPANVSLTAANAGNAWGAELSQKFDFSKEDAADDLLLNEVVWRSVRGPDSPMPPPVRASFVFAGAGEDDDDEGHGNGNEAEEDGE